MSKKLQILVCCHKKDEYIRTYEPYLPIQVGKALHPDINLGFIGDNEGDNISEKNPKYCEWTALYWGWKNLKDVQYKGLCHYRRYFDASITSDNIENLLKDKDIILTNERKSIEPNFNIPISCMGVENAFLLVDTILSLYPDAERATVDYLLNNNHYTQCSMFIARKEVYDEICEFIFPILESFEKKVPEMPYSRMNRAVAYAGEMLLGLFVLYKGYRVRHIQLDAIGAEPYVYRKWYAKFLDIIFFLTNRPRKTKFNIWTSVKVGLLNDKIKLEYFNI